MYYTVRVSGSANICESIYLLADSNLKIFHDAPGRAVTAIHWQHWGYSNILLNSMRRRSVLFLQSFHQKWWSWYVVLLVKELIWHHTTSSCCEVLSHETQFVQVSSLGHERSHIVAVIDIIHRRDIQRVHQVFGFQRLNWGADFLNRSFLDQDFGTALQKNS